MRFAVMIEGQEDVTWDDWRALARDCERLGFEALFRSDHYVSVEGAGERGSLDAWGTICALAAVTSKLRLGTLVSPATFRHPSILAKLATTADHVSGGRVEVGLGAGWHEVEHEAYGFPFGTMGERMDRLAEQLEIVRGHWGDGTFSFAGEHYALKDLDARPKPVQRPHPPVIMGGSAGPRSAALAARHAAEYNVVMVDPKTAGARREKLEAACREAGRDPDTLGYSLMCPFLIGSEESDLRERADRLAEWRGSPVDLDELRATWIAGTPDEIAARLREYAAAGIRRVMLQHLLHRDSAALELVADRVIPALR